MKSKKLDSAPGDDGILYQFLSKMPYTHYVLATLYNKIRQQKSPPLIWASSKIMLAYKNGEDLQYIYNPEHFRMIALTAIIARLYHCLEGDRIIEFLIKNNYVDKRIQKAYINNVNGCIEHITILQEVIVPPTIVTGEYQKFYVVIDSFSQFE